MYKSITIFFLVFICFSSMVLAQAKKMEREKRVKKEEVPVTIINMMNKFTAKAKKVRYYLETDGNHTSFEIKFLLGKNHYSVEFSNSGSLEDVEVVVDFRKLDKSLHENILSHLKKYDNFKVKKVQKQFSSRSQSDEEVIEMAIQNVATEIVRYEIIVETKADGSWTTYEMVFDDLGNFLSEKEVVGRLADHILY